MFIHLGSVQEGDAFFAQRWPEARAIADPDAVLYEGVALERMKLRQMLSPTVWGRGIQAVRKGNFVGKPVGDPLRMPGMFLVDSNGTVLWSFRSKHVADHPDFTRIPELASRAS